MRSTPPTVCDAALIGARYLVRHPHRTARVIARGQPVAIMCSTWATGTRRATPPKILPRPLQYGSRRVLVGSDATNPGRRLRKLRFVQQFAGELGTNPPPVRSRDRIEPLHFNQRTLAQHYRNKLARMRTYRGLLADRLLNRVFSPQQDRRALTAATFLRSNKPQLLASVMRSTSVDRYGAHQVLRTAISRSERLQLYVSGSQRESLRKTRIMLRRLVRLYMRSQGLRLRA
jgi:hypothetical protein